MTVTAGTRQLAARARDIAAKAPAGSAERKAALVAAVALAEASSAAGATKILAGWEDAPPAIRHAATKLVGQLTRDVPASQGGAAQEGTR